MLLPFPNGVTRADAAGEVATAAEVLDEAVVQLLILDRRIADAEALVHTSESVLDRLETEADDAEADAARTAADLERARSRYSGRLAETYKAGDLGWLEILLTSDSLSDFLGRTTLVNRILMQDAELTRRVEEARAQALAADARLAAAAENQRAQVLEARARRADLQAARSEQASLVKRLGDHLSAARASARAAAARMATVNDGAQTGSGGATIPRSSAPTGTTRAPTAADPATTAATRPSPAGGAPQPGGRTLVVKAYAYALRGTTASGIPVAPGVIAVDPRVIPLGTRLWVPGYGEGIAADTGGDIKGNTIDVWMASEKQASDWGIKTLTITVYD